LRVIITRTPASSRGKETPPRLRVSKDQATTEAPSKLGALDAIARERARRMLMMALNLGIAALAFGRHFARSGPRPASSAIGVYKQAFVLDKLPTCLEPTA
jgi:hypothetical protein